MGERGPIGYSEAEKRLRGTRGRATAPAPTPISPLAKPPRCPAWLSVEAKRRWREIVPELVQEGRVCVLDAAILAAYCTVAADLQKVEAELAAADLLVDSYRGGKKAHPLLSVAARYRRELAAIGKEIGLSPASRARLPAPARQDETDELERWLKDRT